MSSHHDSPYRPRRLAAFYGVAMVGGYLVFGLLGFQLRPHQGASLAEWAATAALAMAGLGRQLVWAKRTPA